MPQISQTRIDRILEWAVTVSFLLMIVTVMVQVIARYALPWSPHWTEEMARFCFIYMVSLGAGLAVKDRSYINVSLFLDWLDVKARNWMDSFILLSIILLMLCMLVFSIPLMDIVSLQDSASLKINMAFIYFSMTCMSAFVAFYSIVELLKNLKKIFRNQ
ncbi:TRAP transporter small permease [Cognataquiflexum rubidum]|uniref:TRAP transporter small permease n=1 Tax=Cognataquiflexum rubidum TaxID=2922273 RepID=UPI001F13EE9E|nr:TRAP transporter small permease [Cognataquiflexum rubidum]MCH6235288.1 TRAP transporter small permease [Cognataquiflexum rubidum]